ncbi:YqaJ-like viral recombinase domain protein [Caedimonas varicaedens]|uniref:YqaJ-like viral recombinase domain protein n=1 Tax=Caedimonas varicaedens TaxID=1629334 RepID=A0A0K8MCA8_9PROT|nr:YqaJ-like viral recombinase domain protein [Caedimonas varicaedens]
MNFTLEQLMERQLSLGGSEVAVALGLSPWKSPYELYIEKTTDDPLSFQSAMSAPQEWGHRLEEVVAQKYQEETGTSLLRGFTYHSLQYPFLSATPDRLVYGKSGYGKALRGLEIKTADARCSSKWGASGVTWDGVDINQCPIPYHYYLQVVAYMAVLGMDRWDLAVLIGGNDYRVYTFTRNLEVEHKILEEARAFWENFVVQKVAPPIDFTAEGVQRLIAKLNTPLQDVETYLDQHWTDKVKHLMDTSEMATLATKKVKEMKAELRHFMGDASIAKLQGGGAVCVKIARDGSSRMTFKS